MPENCLFFSYPIMVSNKKKKLHQTSSDLVLKVVVFQTKYALGQHQG